MTYPRQDVVAFGKQLFATGDLDPVYVAVNAAAWPKSYQARWLIAYWLFYSAGFASWVAEKTGPTFWQGLATAAENTTTTPFLARWPRGAERRHFRGAAAAKAVRLLHERYGSKPEKMLDFLCGGEMDIESVICRAKTHYLFGDWISFKVADMLDAVWGVPVGQHNLEAFLYKTPRASILESWKEGRLPLKAVTQESAVVEAMYWLRQQLGEQTVPHKPGASPDWFSLETVWCKHHSHLHGHYPLLKDVREISMGVRPWAAHSEYAAKFLQGMPTCSATLLS